MIAIGFVLVWVTVKLYCITQGIDLDLDMFSKKTLNKRSGHFFFPEP